MKLIDHIKHHHNGNNAAFARVYGCDRQYVSELIKHGEYYVYDGFLHIRKKEVKTP